MRLFTFTVSLFFSLSCFATTSVITNPLAMTITQRLILPHENNFAEGEIDLKPERKKVFLFEDKATFKFTYQLQNKKQAPLIFIVPGTGALYNSSSSLALAEKFYALGYHTVTVDNAFSWDFALSGSKEGLPGYVPQDATDLYAALVQIKQKLALKQNIQPSSYSMIGNSLGALQIIFMQRIDDTAKAFQFKKVLMIDPPVDLIYAITQIDQLFNEGNHLSENRKVVVFNRSAEAVKQYVQADLEYVDLKLIQNIFDKLQFTARDLSYLIGGNFRDSLRDVIFTSQQISDLKILKSPVSRDHRNLRYEESRKFSFNEYLNLFVMPGLKVKKDKNYSLVDLNREISLYQFEGFIKSHQNTYLVHSEDDFILKAGDIAWLKEKFGDRALIFPYGGHCGSMNFPEFADHLVNLFK
ncbi:MAG: hypothetical protein ACXWRE_13715 [Pseudobdellovibrionaceae bacterium]